MVRGSRWMRTLACLSGLVVICLGARWNLERRPCSSCHNPAKRQATPATPAGVSLPETDASAKPTKSSAKPVRIAYQAALMTPFESRAEASLLRRSRVQPRRDDGPIRPSVAAAHTRLR
jgi:hypothetical protein